MDLKVSVAEKGDVLRDINIEIPRAVYNERLNATLTKTTSQARIKGFRPGHVPRAMVMKLYGQQIHSEVLEHLVSDALRDAVKSHELNVVGDPKISVEADDEQKDVVVKAEVSIFPTPVVENYKTLKFSYEAERLSESDYDKQLDRLRDQHAATEKVEDRMTAENGDRVKISYSGTVDGLAFPGSEGSDVSVDLGSGIVPKDFEDGLIGLEIGKPSDISVHIPESEENKELAGKTAVYTVMLLEINKKSLPEVNDAFATKTGLGENVEDLKTKLKTYLDRDVESRNKNAKEQKLFEVLIEQNPFAIPDVMIDEEIRAMLFEMRVLDRKDRKSYEMDMSAFRPSLGKQAETRVRSSLILEKIIEVEQFDPSTEEVDTWLNEIANQGGQSREALNRETGYPRNVQRLKQMMARQKMIDKLMESAEIDELEKIREQ